MRWPFTRVPPVPSEGPGAQLLQALLSSDPNRIYSASSVVAKLHDAAELEVLAAWTERIERATARVALGSELLAHNVHLQFALRRLRFWRDRAGCLCALYQHYPFFDPRRQAERGQVVIDTVGEAEGGWGEAHRVRCVHCESRWLATDREYHYPWWEWTALPDA